MTDIIFPRFAADNCNPYLILNFSDQTSENMSLNLNDNSFGLYKGILYKGDKTINSIELHAEGITTDKDINYIVNGLDEKVHEGYTLLIKMDGIPADQITGVNIPNYYNFSQWDMPGLAWKGFYYFGARYYDAEVGVWTSTDPAGQFFNPYAYHTNPILFVDPNGEYFDVIFGIVGGIVGTYAGGVISNIGYADNPFNPGEWNWEEPGTYIGLLSGAMAGAQIGTGLGSKLDARIALKAEASFQASNVELAAHYLENTQYAENIYSETIRNNDPIGGKCITDAYDKTKIFAEKMGYSNYPNVSYDNTMVNAYQHQYWQAKLTRVRGRFIARLYGNLHESNIWLKYEDVLSIKMDLGNNYIGRLTARLKGNLYNLIETNMLKGRWVNYYGKLKSTGNMFKYNVKLW